MVDRDNIGQVESVLSLLNEVSSFGDDDSERLLRSIEKARAEMNLLCDEVEHSGFYHEMSNILAQVVEFGSPLAEGKKRALKDACEEMRLRLLANTLVCQEDVFKRSDREPNAAYAVADCDSTSYLPILRWQGGLVSTSVGKSIVILMPALGLDSDFQKVDAGLLEIYDYTRFAESWIIDFSAVKQANVVLFGSLIGYREDFKRKHGDLRVCWMRPNLFPETIMKSLIKALDLHLVGGYLFSSS